jgi:hypothetical protein
MSTRGAIGFVANGKWYVTYNHSDSYPSELGMNVLEFCKSVTDWNGLKERVTHITLVDENSPVPPDLLEKYSCYGVTHFCGVSVNGGREDDWYNLLRDLRHGRILYEIYVGNVEHMLDNHMFLAESLFCEWAYIIDLDEMVLHVYKGLNEVCQKETPLPPDIDPTKNGFDRWGKQEGDEFYPVKLLYDYSLTKLPEFMLGVTNAFKKQYREEHQDNLVQALEKLK